MEERIICELCGQEIEGDDLYVVPSQPDGSGALLTICPDCYAEPPEPPEWVHTPREV